MSLVNVSKAEKSVYVGRVPSTLAEKLASVQHSNATYKFLLSPLIMSQSEKIFVLRRSLDSTLQLPVYSKNLQWGLVRGPSKEISV